jgi:hypothetical protein
MTKTRTWLAACAATVLVAGVPACGGDDVAADFEELDISICGQMYGPFSTHIDNPYYPLPVGQRTVLEGRDDGAELRVVIEVLDETEVVAGVKTRVVLESEYRDGELAEVSRNFIVQATDGTVCYFGEIVDDYSGGQMVGHAGEWLAGTSEGNRPGILMPGSPRIGTKFYQEYAPEAATDMSAIVETGRTVTVPLGTMTDAIHTIDWNPKEGETSADGEDKYYQRGIGLVVDDKVELVSYSRSDD